MVEWSCDLYFRSDSERGRKEERGRREEERGRREGSEEPRERALIPDSEADMSKSNTMTGDITVSCTWLTPGPRSVR